MCSMPGLSLFESRKSAQHGRVNNAILELNKP